MTLKRWIFLVKGKEMGESLKKKGWGWVELGCVWVGGIFFYRKMVPAKPGDVYFIKDRAQVESFSWKDPNKR